MGAAGLCLLAARLARGFPGAVEAYYSLGVYPRTSAFLSWVAGLLPFSLAEALAVVLLVHGMGRMLLGWRCYRRGAFGFWLLLQRGLARLLRWASLAVVAFLLLWGANHARLPLSVSAGLEPVEDQSEALQALVVDLAERLRADAAPSETPGGFAVMGQNGVADERIQQALQVLSKRLPSMKGGAPVLREMTAWPLFAKLGISGLFVPFTGEPHFNVGMPACRWPFVAFHEIAHQRGFAREDEANFLGWWLCFSSGDVHYRYSGNLAAFSIALAALRKTHPKLAQEQIQALPESVLRDILAVQSFWKRYESPAARVSSRINDAYLKSQGQQHGIQSYGRMLDLLLALHAQGF